MPSLRMIGKGRRVADLYILDVDPNNSFICNCDIIHETFGSVFSAINDVTSHI